MNCRICRSETTHVFDGLIMGRHPTEYFRCPRCGFLQTGEPYWLAESYRNPITSTDIGMMARNLRLTELLTAFFYFCADRDGDFLDFGGGYGIFVRLMRDVGFRFHWEDAHAENWFPLPAEEPPAHYGAVTALEVFEHLPDPVATLEQLLSKSGMIVIGTELIPDSPDADLKDWEYLSVHHGQHISFFSEETFRYLAARYHLNRYTDRKSITVLSERKLGGKADFLLSRRHRTLLFLFEYAKRNLHSLLDADHRKLLGDINP